MKIKTMPKGGLFLLEFTIVIIFFALAGALSVNLFYKAHTAAVYSTDLTMAVLEAQSAAECIKGAEDEETVAKLVSGTVTEEGITVYYGEDWEKTSDPTSRCLQISRETAAGLQISEITVTKEKNVLFALTTKAYVGEVSP